RPGRVAVDGLTLHALDGRSNEAAFDEVLDLVAHAREEVFLECPYVTDPFSRELERAARRGVRVRVLTSEQHNFPLLREGLAHAAARSPLELRIYPGRMTHMKALLVDRRALVVGSANFDVWSYRSQQEYLAIVREPGLVAEFERRVVELDLACSKPRPRAPHARDARGLVARLAERLVASGRVSHGFLAECQLRRARLLAAPEGRGTLPDAQAAAALALASEHARLRDPEQEMDGPFEEWGDVKQAIVRLEESWARAPARQHASR
ncbi:MAG TPA: phospholipase D-like domain-containing protein, partial [Planctomycetota bacterium]|nr:phospholipase D-like domain-containing protein [Planctomycetota bacterium]